mgnify:CR=1 FL=1
MKKFNRSAPVEKKTQIADNNSSIKNGEFTKKTIIMFTESKFLLFIFINNNSNIFNEKKNHKGHKQTRQQHIDHFHYHKWHY